MKNKKNLIAIASVVLFLAVFLLGANTVFSVAYVEIVYTVSSAQAQTDSLYLQAQLETEYKGDNIFLVQGDQVISNFADYPYLRVNSFEKSYPNKLILTVEERMERYAVSAQEGGQTYYYMTDAQGDVLDKRTSNQNNVDGGENFLIEGLTYSQESAFSADGNFSVAMQVCAKMETLTGGVRSCLKSLTIQKDAAGTEFIIETQEGVGIRIDEPAELTEQKTEKAIQFYLSLDTADQLYGEIYVTESALTPGEVILSYTARS